MLEREGILRKDPDPTHKQKLVYSLTRAGIALLPILAEIGLWSVKHREVDPARLGHAVALGEGGKALQEEIMRQLEREHLTPPSGSSPGSSSPPSTPGS